MKNLILLLTICLFAQELIADERRFSQTTKYRDTKRSLVEWDKLDPVDYLDYQLWLNDTKLKDQWPDWEKTVREKRSRELYGKVLHCVGICRMYRGVGNYKTQFRSTVLEGDELITGENSYAWIFLLDGTMVRMSPSSSITFREINVGVSETFLHARINAGNVLWLSRTSDQYEEINDRETDIIFFPLQFYKAMPVTEKVNFDEESLFNLLERPNTVLNQYKRLNKLVEENNKLFKKRDTYAFLVTPNGTVSGNNLHAEFISLIGNESFVKIRTNKQLGFKTKDGASKGLFSFRGFENKESQYLNSGTWYRIGKKGKVINEYFDTQLQQVGELMTKRVPTIFVARELLLREYSEFKNFTEDPELLALKYGYRKWGELKDPKSDMSLRLSFLTEYTRRIETTNLVTSSRLREKLIARGEATDDMQYSLKFFNRALLSYMRQTEVTSDNKSDREVLNSTTKKFWKIINAIK